MSGKIVNHSTKEISQQVQRTVKNNNAVPHLATTSNNSVKNVVANNQPNLLHSTFALVESTPGY